jgi:TRAP transporter 4TM/12TM fusion protein
LTHGTEAKDWRRSVTVVLSSALVLFTLAEVNYPQLSPQSQLAIFAGLGLVLCFLNRPFFRRRPNVVALRVMDVVLAVLAVVCCAFVVIQTEPLFRSLWTGGQSLGNRAGQEAVVDIAVGAIGLLLVIEATRRSLGWALPMLALLFLAYAWFGPQLPDWLFPHRGYGVERLVAQTFLHSQGVFGVALRVMFTYVFLFVIFGAVLKQTGATRYIIDFARRLFGASPGGPAKVAVISSGMMGSLSGSAVANTATTGTFTIPMMRNSGFKPEIAGGVEAAASSGGALVPPVMGAGAYMMLEIIDPPVTYLQIIKAALIPAVLYYFSLFLIVHFYSRRIGVGRAAEGEREGTWWEFEGLIFSCGIVGLIALLLQGFSVFRAVSLAMLLVVLVSMLNPRTRLMPRKLVSVLIDSGRDVIPLIAAAACVGIVIGVVTLTGIGTKLPSTILELSQGDLLSALVLIMISSIVLGMGLPSAICYLLLATLIGPVLGQLGVVPLAAHLFIFYFGMMSMVTPPVALAAYAAGSIAGAGIMQTAFAAFRFALVGFTLPYMFVFRPELLMLDSAGEPAAPQRIALAVLLAVVGILPFAAGIAGYLFNRLSVPQRSLLLLSAGLLLLPAPSTNVAGIGIPFVALVGLVLLTTVAFLNLRQNKKGDVPI